MTKKAMGGRTEPPQPAAKEDERTREMNKEEKVEKRGGKVMGSSSKPRADRRARGGRMTPKSPFTGADGPNLSYARSSVPATTMRGGGKSVSPS